MGSHWVCQQLHYLHTLYSTFTTKLTYPGWSTRVFDNFLKNNWPGCFKKLCCATLVNSVGLVQEKFSADNSHKKHYFSNDLLGDECYVPFFVTILKADLTGSLLYSLVWGSGSCVLYPAYALGFYASLLL